MSEMDVEGVKRAMESSSETGEGRSWEVERSEAVRGINETLDKVEALGDRDDGADFAQRIEHHVLACDHLTGGIDSFADKVGNVLGEEHEADLRGVANDLGDVSSQLREVRDSGQVESVSHRELLEHTGCVIDDTQEVLGNYRDRLVELDSPIRDDDRRAASWIKDQFPEDGDLPRGEDYEHELTAMIDEEPDVVVRPANYEQDDSDLPRRWAQVDVADDDAQLVDVVKNEFDSPRPSLEGESNGFDRQVVLVDDAGDRTAAEIKNGFGSGEQLFTASSDEDGEAGAMDGRGLKEAMGDGRGDLSDAAGWKVEMGEQRASASEAAAPDESDAASIKRGLAASGDADLRAS